MRRFSGKQLSQIKKQVRENRENDKEALDSNENKLTKLQRKEIKNRRESLARLDELIREIIRKEKEKSHTMGRRRMIVDNYMS